ncbi:MAG: hypothetical protein RUMPE_00136 [Eubacteriales bacterium SKADARSKE-1]|nr:hypothetical protein [Eubacteriales bacterium SKADARSKE-1]
MLEVIFSVVMLFLAVMGLIEFVRIISLAVFRVKKDKNEILVVPISGHNENAEMILRNAISRAKWLCGTDNRKVFCIDFDMDAETRQICEIISQECEFLYVCSSAEFIEHIRQEAN